MNSDPTDPADQPEPPSITQRYDALVAIVTEVADELEERGLYDLAARLDGAAAT